MKNEKKRISFAPGTLTAPLPPVIATVGGFDNANIITIGWTGILSSTPPRTYISVRPSRYSHGILKEHGEFVINLPSVSLAREVDYCGIYTGAKVDKFEKCGLTKARSEKVAPPTVAECPIALECRVCDVIEMGSHDVFVADIVSVSCREDIVEDGGRMRFDKADLLAYAHGEYYSLGEIVGRFGFSTDKLKRSETKTASVGKTKSTSAGEKKPEVARKPASELGSKGVREVVTSGTSYGKANDTVNGKANGKAHYGEANDTSYGKTVGTGEGREKPMANAAPFYKTVAKRMPQKKRSDKGAPHGKRGSKGSK